MYVSKLISSSKVCYEYIIENYIISKTITSLVLQITFITKHATPAGFAVALPWAIAGAVYAAGVRMTLRAGGPRPADLAATLAWPAAIAAFIVAARRADC